MSSKASSPSDPLRPSEFVRVEAAALNELAVRLDNAMFSPFTEASSLLVQSAQGPCRIIVTGIGKSGTIGVTPKYIPLSVSDARGTGAGWNLTITSTTLTTGSKSLAIRQPKQIGPKARSSPI